MGKLTFKGDKKRKPKAAKASSHGTHEPSTSSAPSTSISTSESFLEGWSSAQCLGDLNGPCILLASNSDPLILQSDPLDPDKFIASDNVDILSPKDTVNFDTINGTPQQDYRPADRVEPVSVTQVFTVIPINKHTNKSLINHQQTNQFAFKSTDKYLSLNPETGDLQLAHAISTNETFTLHLVPQDHGLSQWIVEAHNNTQLSLDSSNRFKFLASPSPCLNIRVHTKNTVQGSRLLLQQASDAKEVEETGSISGTPVEVKQAVRRLYKELSGKLTISHELITRLKQAHQRGALNEQVLDEKARYSSRW